MKLVPYDYVRKSSLICPGGPAGRGKTTKKYSDGESSEYPDGGLGASRNADPDVGLP